MENINALDEIHKGACMGTDAIDCILDKINDKNFKAEVEREYDNYQDIEKIIEEIYPKYNDGNPHETGVMTKAMTSMHIEMKTLTDESDSKLAELLLQGVNMGVIEGRRILNKKEINKEVEDIVSKYVTMQEESVEALKKYL
ncbi:MAG: hypothetical protein IJ574_03090 [Bacilli bacterium]|nr:hypothetical protein [Bacilli bacterium]